MKMWYIAFNHKFVFSLLVVHNYMLFFWCIKDYIIVFIDCVHTLLFVLLFLFSYISHLFHIDSISHLIHIDFNSIGHFRWFHCSALPVHYFNFLSFLVFFSYINTCFLLCLATGWKEKSTITELTYQALSKWHLKFDLRFPTLYCVKQAQNRASYGQVFRKENVQ